MRRSLPPSDLSLAALAALIAALVVAICLSANHAKADCLSSGGQWVDGVFNGQYDYVCLPSR